MPTLEDWCAVLGMVLFVAAVWILCAELAVMLAH